MTQASPTRGAPWVVLSSANGSTNLGDEAMWEASVQALRSVLGPVPVVTDGQASFRPGLPDVQVLPYLHLELRRGSFLRGDRLERAISYPGRNAHALARARSLLAGRRGSDAVSRWREAVRSAPGVIISGAGAMTDDFAPHGVVSWWLVSQWARAAGVPVILLGQGVGPLVDPALRATAAELLAAAAVVNVREEASAAVVRELAPAARTVVTPDWAVLDVPDDGDRARADAFLASTTQGRSFVALSAHRRHNTTRTQLAELSRSMLDVVTRCRTSGRPVVFVPNMTGTTYSDDRATFDLLAGGWPDELRRWVHVVRDPLGPRATRALLGRADVLATTRYHPLVFAMAEGTHAVGVSYDAYYDQKLTGASAMFGVTDNVRRADDVDADWVLGAPSLGSAPRPVGAERNVEVLAEALGRRDGVLQDC